MMTDRLMNAIFSMDAYNRGYNSAVKGLSNAKGTRLGTAVVFSDDSSTTAIATGFYAIAYSYNGVRTIAYRGTDGLALDIANGYSLGAGFGTNTQGLLAVDFYRAVVGSDAKGVARSPYTAPIVTTGHSLGGGLAGYVAML